MLLANAGVFFTICVLSVWLSPHFNDFSFCNESEILPCQGYVMALAQFDDICKQLAFLHNNPRKRRKSVYLVSILPKVVLQLS
jgi:hypothetical protein